MAVSIQASEGGKWSIARFALAVGAIGLVVAPQGGYSRGWVNNPWSGSVRIPRSTSRLSFSRMLLTLLGAISRSIASQW